MIVGEESFMKRVRQPVHLAVAQFPDERNTRRRGKMSDVVVRSPSEVGITIAVCELQGNVSFGAADEFADKFARQEPCPDIIKDSLGHTLYGLQDTGRAHRHK